MCDKRTEEGGESRLTTWQQPWHEEQVTRTQSLISICKFQVPALAPFHPLSPVSHLPSFITLTCSSSLPWLPNHRLSPLHPALCHLATLHTLLFTSWFDCSQLVSLPASTRSLLSGCLADNVHSLLSSCWWYCEVCNLSLKEKAAHPGKHGYRWTWSLWAQVAIDNVSIQYESLNIRPNRLSVFWGIIKSK